MNKENVIYYCQIGGIESTEVILTRVRNFMHEED
jgi:hypothetical protein